MNRQHALATRLMWLALPITALDYWKVWYRLPARMAVHFDANWHANGWASREAAFGLGVGMALFVLVVFTIVSYGIRKSPTPDFMRWALLAFFYVIMIFFCALNHWVIRYNLEEGTTSSVQNSKVGAITTAENLRLSTDN